MTVGDREEFDGRSTVTTPEVRWARTHDGADIAYQDFGSGPITLVVMNGWVSHLEVYWEQPRYARFMRRLSASMRVVVFDTRGIGMSDRLSGDVSLETRMDDVKAVMDHAGVDRAALLGWGMGAPALGAFFTATLPERVIALCMDAEIQERKRPDWQWGETDAEFESSLTTELASWGKNLATGYTDTHEDRGLAEWEGKMARFAATPASYETFARVLFSTDVMSALTAIQVPTLVIAKEANGYGGPDMAASLATRISNAKTITIPGSEGVVWFDDPEPFVAAIESFLGVQAAPVGGDRVLATVLFTDIVGSTALAARMGDADWSDLLGEHNERARAEIDRYRGRFIDSAGDGLFALFDGPARAVRCAQSIGHSVRDLGLEIRASCHTGEVEIHRGSARGITVHTGARIAALAGPSEVLVSSVVKDLTPGSGLEFKDAGLHELKGVPDRWRLYRLNQ